MTATWRRQARLVTLAAATLTAALATASCGVPTGSESFERIPDDDVGFRLSEQSTTTTTTSTTTVPLIDPTTTIVAAAPPTTAGSPTNEPVAVYFLLSGSLDPVFFDVSPPITASLLRTLLVEGPGDEDTAVRRTTEIDDGLIRATSEAGGVLTVDLDSTTFDRILRTRQDDAIAQMVLTFTRNLRGVGQVQFTLDGEIVEVPRADGGLTAEPVSFDDYTALLSDAPTDSLPLDPGDSVPDPDEPLDPATTDETDTSDPLDSSNTTDPDG